MTAKHNTGAGRLVAVVITWNRLPELQITLQRLLESPAAILHAIVVVENASTDGSGDWLRAQSDARLDVIYSETNTGGAGGFAMGMRHAVSRHDPDWLVVMDDDARPTPAALETFHACQPERWDAIAAAVYMPDGSICDMNRPARNPFAHKAEFWRTLWKGRAGFHLGPEDYRTAQVRSVDVSSFVGFFISRRGLDLAGYPDPGLFLYGDDGIYTLGLHRRGGLIGFDPSIRFEHALSTFDGRNRRFRPLWKVYYYHRNLLLLYRMAAGGWFWLALLVILPKWLFKMRHHKGERWMFLALVGRAVRDGLLRRTSVPHERVLAWAGSPGAAPSSCHER